MAHVLLYSHWLRQRVLYATKRDILLYASVQVVFAATKSSLLSASPHFCSIWLHILHANQHPLRIFKVFIAQNAT
jgi:hypothetical protein